MNYIPSLCNRSACLTAACNATAQETAYPLGRCQRSLILAPADAAEEIACGGVARR
jgi:hypothetical protein